MNDRRTKNRCDFGTDLHAELSFNEANEIIRTIGVLRDIMPLPIDPDKIRSLSCDSRKEYQRLVTNVSWLVHSNEEHFRTMPERNEIVQYAGSTFPFLDESERTGSIFLQAAMSIDLIPEQYPASDYTLSVDLLRPEDQKNKEIIRQACMTLPNIVYSLPKDLLDDLDFMRSLITTESIRIVVTCTPGSGEVYKSFFANNPQSIFTLPNLERSVVLSKLSCFDDFLEILYETNRDDWRMFLMCAIDNIHVLTPTKLHILRDIIDTPHCEFFCGKSSKMIRCGMMYEYLQGANQHFDISEELFCRHMHD